ncbi:ATP-binding protein [bacterium]|nr:ATP-binding protein [bacterium]
MAKASRDLLDQLNPWWQNHGHRYKLFDRKDYTAELVNRQDRLIQVLTGGRRVGKTSILRTVINNLLHQKVKPQHIIFITGELREIKEQGIRRTIEILILRLKADYRAEFHIFIDEVQEIPKWQEEIKLFYDTTHFRFYVSGSSSLILTRQTAKLTGRYRLQHVLPFSFLEFIKFNEGRIGDGSKHHSNALKEKYLDEYLRIGGYPEYVINKDPAYLRQCVESTLYRELLTEYGIRNPALLQDLIYFLADKVTNEVSVKRIQKDLKIDDKTARYYLKYLQDVYLIYPVYRAGKSNRITKGSNPKYYFNDPGVLTLMGKTPRLGHQAENCVFLQLLRKQLLQEIPRIEYDIIEGQEVDFVVDGKYYEVKAVDEINLDLLEQYADLGKKIAIISLKSVKNYQNKFSALSLSELKDFLTADSVK